MARNKKKDKEVDSEVKKQMLSHSFVVSQMKIAIPDTTFWIPLTSKKDGNKVFLPLPIRMIRQVPTEKGGGCVVRGYYGDECVTKENICEILRVLNGVPLGEGASCWEIAT